MDTTLSNCLHIGCAGWSIPKSAADRFSTAGSHLSRFANRLTAVEINSSFYRPHRAATYERWSQSVPRGFCFSVKLPKQITHIHQLCHVDDLLGEFLSGVLALGRKLGPLLVQLPPSLEFDLGVAGTFFRQLRERFAGHVACEPRHWSWFVDAAEQLLVDFDIARVAADPAREPSAGVPGGFGGLVYYRLHGSPKVYHSSYDTAYLEPLAEELVRTTAMQTDVWCIFDNTAAGAATINALELTEIASQIAAGR